jgi:hypothetical protein
MYQCYIYNTQYDIIFARLTHWHKNLQSIKHLGQFLISYAASTLNSKEHHHHNPCILVICTAASSILPQFYISIIMLWCKFFHYGFLVWT